MCWLVKMTLNHPYAGPIPAPGAILGLLCWQGGQTLNLIFAGSIPSPSALALAPAMRYDLYMRHRCIGPHSPEGITGHDCDCEINQTHILQQYWEQQMIGYRDDKQ
jgi:hypothetical protein